MRERGGEVVSLPEAAPEYFSARITGRINLCFRKMCLKKKKLCRVFCGFEWNRKRTDLLYLDEEKWDGSDFCRVASNPGYIICSQRVMDLIKKEKIKGFSIEPCGGE